MSFLLENGLIPSNATYSDTINLVFKITPVALGRGHDSSFDEN
jgi:hypothetical protein